MTRRSLVGVVGVVAILVAGVVHGQQAGQSSAANAAPLPDARTIIDRHVQAIGGRAAIRAHTSTHASGTVSIPSMGLSGSFEMYSAAPSRTLRKISMSGAGESVQGFDGEVGWRITPKGASLDKSDNLEQRRLDADYYGELHDPARYTSMMTVEKTTFDGRACYRIELVRKDGAKESEFYDVATGLNAGSVRTRVTATAMPTVTETRGDYKKFGDILQPTSISLAGGGVEQRFVFKSYEYDKVDAAVFAAPNGAKTPDVPSAVAGLKIDQVVAALKLQSGQSVADIGAGVGLYDVPFAKAVGPTGRVYAVEIDRALLPEIRKRAVAGQAANVEPVLGESSDPALPVKSVDVAFFRDVLHHIENQPAYLKTVARYVVPAGRIVVIDFEVGKGPHRNQPELQVTREQLTRWMRDAGFAPIEDIHLLTEEYFLVFGRR